MSISIIIPTYNGANRVFALTSQLLEWDNPYELIIVNDGSTDDTLTRLKDFSDQRLIVITQDNAGRASARNVGANRAGHEILWFLDDDMTVPQENLGKINQHFADIPGSILVGGQFEQPDQCISDIQKYKAFSSKIWQRELGTTKTKVSQPYITAANFSIEKKTFNRLTGFDNRLRDTEDYDLALRAMNNKVDIYFHPGVIGIHAPIHSALDYARRLKEYHESEKKLRALKPELSMYPLYRPGMIKRMIYSFFYSEKWLKRIDREELNWMPRNVRYRLYSVILTAHSKLKGG